MQPSTRARHDSPAPNPDAAVIAGQASGKPGWFPALARRFAPKTPEPKAAKAEVDPLLAFPSESGPAAHSAPAPAARADAAAKPAPARPAAAFRRPKALRSMVFAGVIAAVAVPTVGVLAIRRFPIPPFASAQPRTGNLTIDTRPAGSQVLIDGQGRGVTPLTVALEPGAHTITLRSGSDERVVPLTIAPGAEVSQYYEMKVAEPVVVAGSLSITTDPPGARVSVDGNARGNSPLTVAGLAAEPHKITVTNDAGTVERTVAVAAGSTTSVMFALPKASGPMAGWLSISAPFDVEVMENRDVIGTSGSSRIMLAAGRHDLILANHTLGYQEARRIDVTAGQTVSIRVDAPKASVSVNARPWAEILIDGSDVGQTPIANIQISVGTHEMVFRHPQFGERKQTIVVTAKGPNRITADLTK
jgi:hypothetical protein